MKYLLFSMAMMLVVSGCSTIFNSGNQSMRITPSEPKYEGVEVSVTTPSGSYTSKLPTTVTAAPPNPDKKVEIKVIDECYDPTAMTVGKTVSPSYFINILFWPGFFVDYFTGAMWNYDDNTVIPAKKKPDCT